MFMLVLHIIIILYISYTSAHKKNSEGEVLLTPVEIIDLVREENSKITGSSKAMKTQSTTPIPDEEDNTIHYSKHEEREADKKTLSSRKIWCSWSKWSPCSVTCGDGSHNRYRLCVAGRCAHGEREEQRRPCARAPCHMIDYNGTEEPETE